MPGLPLIPPLINGRYYSFASIEARVAGVPFVEFTAINYSPSLDPADVYGSRSQKLGRTRGKQNAEGSIEMYRGAWDRFRSTLQAIGQAAGVGYGLVEFPVTVTYAEGDEAVVTDQLIAARITKVDYQNSEGNDATKVTLTLNVMRIYEGAGRIDEPLGIAF